MKDKQVMLVNLERCGNKGTVWKVKWTVKLNTVDSKKVRQRSHFPQQAEAAAQFRTKLPG